MRVHSPNLTRNTAFIDGQADLILSGDQDLLVLSPFRGIPVVTPMQYLDED